MDQEDLYVGEMKRSLTESFSLLKALGRRHGYTIKCFQRGGGFVQRWNEKPKHFASVTLIEDYLCERVAAEQRIRLSYGLERLEEIA